MRLTARTRRRGATLAESALVIAVFLLVLFGIFEYCRFLMVLHVANNAARDAARYAAVNTGCPGTTVAGMKAQVESYATARMGGVDRQVQGYQVAVYACDPSGFGSTPPKVVAKSNPAGATVDPFQPYNSSSNPLADWNAATFTERIAVTIKGTYRPVVPLSVDLGWLKLSVIPDNIPVNVTAVMGSEG
jgi:Flp pilus assembly protein TadG